MLSLCFFEFAVSVRAFDMRLSQISSFFLTLQGKTNDVFYYFIIMLHFVFI